MNIVLRYIILVWLLTATLEAFLAGNRGVALPAAIFSGIIFLVCAGLYVFVDRVDSEVRKARSIE